MSLYSTFAKPVLFALDAERAHNLTLAGLGQPVAPVLLRTFAPAPDPRLQTTVFGLSFANPIGLAAGLDKQGTAVAAWQALGFGFAEIGTITPKPQPGNPLPRLFRLPDDRAIINRFGFNSEGAERVAQHLSTSRARLHTAAIAPGALRLGINVGKNKETPNEQAVDDFARTAAILRELGDYFVVNVSSPNTPGLRSLQDGAALRPIVERVLDAIDRRAPVLVKVSPDMHESDLFAAVDAAIDGGAAGVIATNTTLGRDGLRSPAALTAEAGGLSGVPLRQLANETCARLYRHLAGRVPIIGVGGIASPEAAYERIRSGASLLQIYSGLIYEGPGLVARIAAGVSQRLARDGFATIHEAVGVDVR